MEVERRALICFCLGFIQGATKMNTADAKIFLDQKLIEMNQPMMTKDEMEYMRDLNDEMGFTLMQMGINRKDIRDMGMHKK